MANLTTGADLRGYVLDRAGELTDGTSEFHSQVLEYLNRQYLSICLGGCEVAPDVREDWWWLRKYPPGVLTLSSPITTGTVLVTQGQTSITFSAAPAASVATWSFQTAGDPTVYRVSAHTGGQTGATLDSAYVGTTDAAATYTLLKLEYDLAVDVLRLIGPLRCALSNGNDDPYKIYAKNRFDLETWWPPVEMLTGVPEYYSVVQQVTTETGSATKTTVRFNRGGRSEGQTRVEYDYLRKPSVLAGSSEEPLIPWEWRHVLADAALYLLLVQKNDSRADTAGLSAKTGLLALQREHRRVMGLISERMGTIRPRASEETAWRASQLWRA